MENFLHIVAIWAHIIGIAVFVGPQFFLAMGVIPATRGITDPMERARATRVVTTRFGWLAGVGLFIILVAGTYLIASWRDYYGIPDDVAFLDLRYGVVFTVKMTVLIFMVIAVGLHVFVVGPRQLDLMEEHARGAPVDAELGRMRRLSMFLSISGLVLALVIMIMGASLSTANYSLQEF